MQGGDKNSTLEKLTTLMEVHEQIQSSQILYSHSYAMYNQG